MSPVDVLGGQFLWFIGQDEDSGRAVFFTVLVQDPGGLSDVSGSLAVQPDHVPAGRRVGTVYAVTSAEDEPSVRLLEAPPALACRSLQDALALNWHAGATTPMGYRLFSPLIWLSDEAKAASGAEAEERQAGLVGEPPELDELLALFDHPAFAGWIETLHAGRLDAESLASFGRRLDAMSRWLAAAGDEGPAQAAAALAQRLEAALTEPGDLAEIISFLESAARGRQESQDQSKENRNV